MSKKLVLVGMVEPETEDLIEAFNEWYIGNHVEDTYNCPKVKSVTCYKSVKEFMGDTPGGYMTIYEFEGEDAEAAQAALGAYQADPNAYPAREENNGSMKIVSSGWYLEELGFGPK
jgi:hypothetical protein